MRICKDGKYTKYFLTGEKDVILAFIPQNEEDNYFKIMQEIRKVTANNYNGFQCCEINEEKKHFRKVFVMLYNIYGQPIKEGVLLEFDFDNSIVCVGEKKYKVKKDNEYTYYFKKTIIKAKNGIEGLYQHVIESIHVDSSFNNSFYKVLENESRS